MTTELRSPPKTPAARNTVELRVDSDCSVGDLLCINPKTGNAVPYVSPNHPVAYMRTDAKKGDLIRITDPDGLAEVVE